MKKIIAFFALAFCLNGEAQIITTVAGNGLGAGTFTCCYSGDGGQATAAELNSPYGLTFDDSGNIFIADTYNNVIRKITSSGIISTFAGNGTAAYSGDGGQATAAGLNGPSGVVFDASGNLFIADSWNNSIRIINTSGIITTIAGNGITGFGGDGGPATAAELNNPNAMTIDASGNVYIADAQNNRIRKVNALGIISTVAGNGIAGAAGDGGQATAAQLNGPADVAFDASGNLYIADQSNNRIRKINTSGTISTIAGYTTTVGFSGDGGAATAAQLYYPAGVTVDNVGNLYVADVGNNRVRLINTTGIISSIVGNGAASFSGDWGQATAAGINKPSGVAFDATGNLYVADFSNNRIRRITNVGQTNHIGQFASNDEWVKIYPNPTSNNFIIETNSTDKQTLQLFDVNGKLVLSQTINGKTNIDASNLAEGVYNLSLISANGVTNKRLVIVR